MYDAPSDRDYLEYLNPQPEPDEDPDNELPPIDTAKWVYPVMHELPVSDDDCPF